MKNTFIHFDVADEPPAKIRRVNSGPASVALAAEEAKGAKPAAVEPAKAKKVAWADIEDDPEEALEASKANSSKNDKRADVAGKSRSRSRARSRSDARGGPPNELSEEERLAKRFGYVSAVKETEGYKAYLKCRERGEAKAKAAPRTPDPDSKKDGDSSKLCSKRDWERMITKWRQSLAEWGEVTVTGEEIANS